MLNCFRIKRKMLDFFIFFYLFEIRNDSPRFSSRVGGKIEPRCVCALFRHENFDSVPYLLIFETHTNHSNVSPSCVLINSQRRRLNDVTSCKATFIATFTFSYFGLQYSVNEYYILISNLNNSMLCYGHLYMPQAISSCIRTQRLAFDKNDEHYRVRSFNGMMNVASARNCVSTSHFAAATCHYCTITVCTTIVVSRTSLAV